MDWDIFTGEPQQETTARGERLDCPEGEHELKIESVQETADELKLELSHDDRRYWWIKCYLKKNAGWAKILVGQLVGALAMGRDEWLGSPKDELVGRRVRAEIYHKVKPDGRLFVNVGRFMPIEQLVEEAAAKAKPARTPAAKVKAASPAIGSDDIPF